MTFREKLRELRNAAGLSEQKLADATGIPFGTIHDYGMRPSRPSFDVVLKLAKALGVSCEAFAGCSDLVGADQQPGNPVVTTNGKPTRSKKPVSQKPGQRNSAKPGKPSPRANRPPTRK